VADSPTYGAGILDELRRILKDTAYEYPQFSMECTDGAASSAIVEVTDSTLVTTITGGTTSNLSISLTNANYATIEKLVNYINTQSNYSATMIGDGDPNHASSDLQIMPPSSIKVTNVIFRSRRWADSELSNAVDRAVSRHNLSIPNELGLNYAGNYTAANLPKEHWYFVLLLSQIEAIKILIQDSSKRRGIDLNVTDAIAIKVALESEYTDQLNRFLARSNALLTEDDTKDLGSGDVLIGHSYRESLRTGNDWSVNGYRYPSGPHTVGYGISPKPSTETLTVKPLGSGKVQVTWTRNRDTSFWKYELWRSTDSDVSNIADTVQPAGAIESDAVKVRTEYWQEKSNWIDGAATALDVGTYYYTLYVFNRNSEQTQSNVVKVVVT